MTPACRPWLPETALTHAAVKRLFSDRIEDWSERWFGRRDMSVSAPMHSHAPASGTTRSTRESVCEIEISPLGRRAIIEASLAVDLSNVTIEVSDRFVIDTLADRIIDDLLAQFPAVEEGLSGTDERCCSLALNFDQDALLTLWLPQSYVITLLKPTYLSTKAQRPTFVGRKQALGKSSISIEGFLGYGSLSLSDLDTMAPGDVIILDRKSADGVSLRMADTKSILINGRLDRSDDKPTIHV